MIKRVCILTILLLLFGAISVTKYKEVQNLQIMFYDIGQGDATLLKFPGNYSILIDGGPDDRILGYLGANVNPFLKNIDVVVATHNHADHTNGLKYVIERYNVTLLVTSPASSILADVASSRNVTNKELIMGDKIIIPTPGTPSEITILWPPTEIFSKNCGNFCDINTDDPNNTSLVFMLTYKNFKAVFTGDAPREVLDAILDNVGDVNLVKVPHQGSKNSLVEEFYRKLKPEIAVIPVGKNNYGHPDPDVVSFLENIGAKVYKTLEHGSVTVITDGTSIITR
ncbi:hypothetical protein COT49_02090 [candidate division WWE3 bacterium CG08_land_8_20_14_0_20_40_13]|uniref:Metallo-beta-lactamase domain-containing protein n=1 Tax=candidate division WWE3 bacterium CG08_land_8_20_14_0_20_40_13 TaxID=1975084 RepID=A0A2H0XDP9_UNCKA|nr:MAG: hypothetical protein COT49_02090 [candidate division WWE3 bacterium CG08_land_8_20_14_0_20_40_13]